MMTDPTPEPPTPTPLDLFGDPGSVAAIVWGGRRMIAAGVAAALTFALAYLAVAPRVYQATAKLLVIEHGARPMAVAGAGSAPLIDGVEDSIPTHAALVSSPVVIRRAVESIGRNNLPSLGPPADDEAAVRLVMEGLSVSRPDRQAKILQVSYRSGARDEATRVVQAVVTSYAAFLEEVYARGNGEVVVLMSRARDDLNRELKELEQRYLEFRQDSPQLALDPNGRSFLSQQVDDWNRAAREAMVKAVQLKSQLELGRELAGSGVGLWSIAYAMDQVAGPAGNAGGGGLAARVQGFGPSAPSDYLRQLAAEQQKLSDSLGPQSTKVREIQEQISQAQVTSRTARGKLEQGEVGELLASVGKSLASLEAMRNELQRRSEADLARAKKTEIAQLAEGNLKNELERHRTLYHAVVDQLKQARLVGDYAGTTAQVIEPPNTPAKPVQPRASLTLLLALAAGGALGLAAALAAELVAPRLRSAGEIRRLLRVPLLGQLPSVPEAQVPPSGSLALLCQERPRSPSAEAYRVLRANLDLARRGRDAKVVLVTSPHEGGGTSTVASNLAVSLAQAGRKVALVDGDLRTPCQHKAFGTARERGLVHLLRGLMPLSRVVQPTRTPGLDLVASGPEAPNPTELMSSAALADLLGRLREEYDEVILDAPPLHRYADASILAAAADGVILVVRLSVSRRADAARSLETLAGVGTPVLGTVSNGAPADRTPVWPWGVYLRAATGGRDASSRATAAATATAFIPYDPQVSFTPTSAPPRPVVSNGHAPGSSHGSVEGGLR